MRFDDKRARYVSKADTLISFVISSSVRAVGLCDLSSLFAHNASHLGTQGKKKTDDWRNRRKKKREEKIENRPPPPHTHTHTLATHSQWWKGQAAWIR